MTIDLSRTATDQVKPRESSLPPHERPTMDSPDRTNGDGYNASAFPRFGVTVDLVVLAIREEALQVLLVRRARWPYAGMLALPGGFIKAGLDASIDQAAERELLEETGLEIRPESTARQGASVHVEQLRTYWRPGRDPRPGIEVATVVYLAVVPDSCQPVAGGDAADAQWINTHDVLTSRVALAFDHSGIVADAVVRTRSKLEYTDLGTYFLPEEFTIAQLRRIYEIVWDAPVEKRNFHRKVTHSGGLLTPTGQIASRGRGRPAELFRRGPADVLRWPLLRPDQSESRG